MIVVSGASGALGRLVVERLLEREPAERIAVSVRDPARVADLEQRGVRVRRADYADPDSLARAFEGASRVLVVSANTVGDEAVRLNRAGIEAAVAAGAQHVLYTSHMGADPSSPFPPMITHAATEEILRGCGAPATTALRHGFYAATVPRLVTGALATGELRAPGDGPVAWTAHADLAEAAAVALTADALATDAPADTATPPLTGPEALTLVDVAALVAELAGREVRRVVVCDDAYRAGLVTHGVPAAGADMLVGMFAAARQGAFAPADPALSAVIGRPTTPLHDVLADHLAPAH
ncbi:NAD(P)H-binding protein [Actinomycetospora sp. CA-101289]|uniref:NmrA family NAD(P)-binding protein n=1 Tax=Actinomycetospora sp. CA-101289 TaxID=3239893 RepID=UPI003D97122F